MPPDPRVHVGVGAVVLHPDEPRLLMIRRGGTGEYASDGHGTYSVPGGWLDYGERPAQAAEREVLEETGVEVRAIKPLNSVCCFSEVKEAQIITLFIRCIFLDGVPRVTEPEKCPEVAWVPLYQVREQELPLFAPLRTVVEEGSFEEFVK